jgi:phage tail sheath protein FI
MIAVPDASIAYRAPGPQADLDVQRVQDAMVDLCERQKDRFALLDAPPTRNLDQVRKWRQRYSSSYAALFYPWLIVDAAGRRGDLTVPPSGHIAGLLARCDTERGVHKAPGNELVRGVAGLTIELREDDLGSLNDEHVNAIRSVPGRGVRTWGARTLSDDPDWRYINVRRLFIMLRRTLEEGTRWVVFEANDQRTWDVLTREVTGFLGKQFDAGAFAGATPLESFFVRCDLDTNTPERIDLGQLTMEIGIAPALPAEYVIFSVVQKVGEGSSRPGTIVE